MLLKNAKILTMAGTDYESGCISVTDGKFERVAASIDGDGIDCTGLTVIPGIVDPHSHIGMWEDGMNFEGDDGNEMVDPLTPELRAVDAINPFDPCFAEVRAGGVTTVVTGPGSANVLGGQFAAVKTKEGTVEQKLIKAPAALKSAFGENPKCVYSEQKKSPSTRMAVAAILRKALAEGQDYIRDLERAKDDPDKTVDRDLQKEIVAQVLRGELIMKCHAHRRDDILTAIRIAREFGIRISLDHCTEGYMMPEVLKDAGYPVIIGPLLCDRSKIELRNLSIKAPVALYEAGVPFALMTDHPVTPAQYLTVVAALAVREGLPAHEAIAAITINAARACDIADRVGSIEPGKDADLVAYAGDPLDIRSRIAFVMIDGEIVCDNR